MDSDDDDRGFARQGGEALDLGEDFDSEEEVDDEEEDDDEVPQPQTQTRQIQQRAQPQSLQKGPSPGKKGDVKGHDVENQHFDLAVEVNDSEEIDSDEDQAVQSIPKQSEPQKNLHNQ